MQGMRKPTSPAALALLLHRLIVEAALAVLRLDHRFRVGLSVSLHGYLLHAVSNANGRLVGTRRHLDISSNCSCTQRSDAACRPTAPNSAIGMVGRPSGGLIH